MKPARVLNADKLGELTLDLSMKVLISLANTRGHKCFLSIFNIFIIHVFPKIHRGVLPCKVEVSLRSEVKAFST